MNNGDYVYVTKDVRINATHTDIGLKIGENWYSVRRIMETKFYIVYKSKEVGLFKLNKAQEKLYFIICDRLANHLPADIIILKARQLGFTTFIQVFSTVMTLFRANQDSVIIANTDENASKIFEKYKFSYQELKVRSPALAPQLQNQTGRILKTKYSNSSIRIAPSTTDAVRGSTLSIFHGSECAFWANMDDVLAAVDAALPDVSINPVVFRFLESTANGYNNFKDYWDDAVERYKRGEKSATVPLFVAWFEDDTYTVPYDGFELSEFERMKMEKHNLTLDQITFWHRQLVKKRGNVALTLQEYPFDPEDAFRSSGNSVFDNEVLSVVKDEVLTHTPLKASFDFKVETIAGDIDDWKMLDLKLTNDQDGVVEIYEKPQQGVPYCIGVDMAYGLGHDSSVAQVVRNDTKKQVAIMASNRINGERFGILVAALGYYYNDALIGVETAANGETAIAILKKFDYRNIYIREVLNSSMGANYTEVYGVKTTRQTKPAMIENMRFICDSYPLGKYRNITDYKTITEMEAFAYDYGDNPQIGKEDQAKMHGFGRHDDKVMALAIAYYIGDQQRKYVETKKEEEIKFSFPPELQTESDNEDYEVEDAWHLYYQ